MMSVAVHVTMESPWHGPAVPELVSMIEDAWDEEYPMLTSEMDDARPPADSEAVNEKTSLCKHSRDGLREYSEIPQQVAELTPSAIETNETCTVESER